MGYLFFPNGDVNNKKELVERIIESNSTGGFEFLRKVVKGSVMYALIKNPSGDIFNVVFLLKQMKGEFGYKDMDESMNPYYYDCPKSYLEAATVEDKSGWRAKCYERQALKKRISHLPNGTIIELINGKKVEFLYSYNSSNTQFVARQDDGQVFRWKIGYIENIIPQMKLVS